MNDFLRNSIIISEAELDDNPQHALDLARQNHVIITDQEGKSLYVMLPIDDFNKFKSTMRQEI